VARCCELWLFHVVSDAVGVHAFPGPYTMAKVFFSCQERLPTNARLAFFCFQTTRTREVNIHSASRVSDLVSGIMTFTMCTCMLPVCQGGQVTTRRVDPPNKNKTYHAPQLVPLYLLGNGKPLKQ
jgi:hypothetical protein